MQICRRSSGLLLWVALIFSGVYSQKNELSKKISKIHKPNIVIVNLHKGLWRGIEAHSFNSYKAFFNDGYKVIMVVAPQSELEKKLKEANLPCITPKREDLFDTLYQVCKELPADIVITSFGGIVTHLKKIKSELPIKIIVEYHSSIKPNPKIFTSLDGVVATNQEVAATLKRLTIGRRMSCKHVEWIPPFFDQEKFLSFKTQQTKAAFFKEKFNIKISAAPIVCMIGNMYGDVRFKNYPLLFCAIKKLLVDRYKPVQVMLAGDGFYRKKYETLVKKMKLQKYVHFLGFTDQIPALLYHSDINVLTSSKEAFGLVYVEAGFMKKPSIGATKTGATSIIQNGESGFLFKNNDVDDLVGKLEILLKDSSLRVKQGERAYELVGKKFSVNSLFTKYNQFLQRIVDF
jgi:glycosyltransferase involved in cell wall biosynthesis